MSYDFFHDFARDLSEINMPFAHGGVFVEGSLEAMDALRALSIEFPDRYFKVTRTKPNVSIRLFEEALKFARKHDALVNEQARARNGCLSKSVGHERRRGI